MNPISISERIRKIVQLNIKLEIVSHFLPGNNNFMPRWFYATALVLCSQEAVPLPPTAQLGVSSPARRMPGTLRFGRRGLAGLYRFTTPGRGQPFLPPSGEGSSLRLAESFPLLTPLGEYSDGGGSASNGSMAFLASPHTAGLVELLV